MRFAVLTDIHANREAFEAVLADAAARGFDRIVILGDVVGYGPDPEWCADKAAALVAEGATCIKGNHDHAATGAAEPMNGMAQRAIEWTRTRLSEPQKAFLRGLPMQAEAEDVLFVHASANDPAAWSYVTSDTRAIPSFRACKARVILCGHVHVPLLASCDFSGMVREQSFRMAAPIPLIRSRRWLAVVGSVGQPRDGVAQAGYAVLDTGTNELSFLRVPYDMGPTVQKIRAAGLPEDLALRLMWGQ
jgi:diadenosine tetraphosphatase ApaH/serine/threonine PP2A family protein phosphatase